MRGRGGRAQAFTLEGVVGSAIVLAALVFALQSVVVAPTSSGAVDQSARLALHQQAEDALTTVAHDDETDLSHLVRYWSSDQGTFYGATNRQVGYGTDRPPGPLGTVLAETFTARDRTYNLVVRYQTPGGGFDAVTVVDRGNPDESAVVASYRVTLYDDQPLTAPDASPNVPLTKYGTSFGAEPGFYPIPDVGEKSPLYNVVEVRLVVW